MSDPAFNSVALQDYIDRWQAGDRSAADDLLRATAARLEKLARRMCKSFPNVRGWADTGDVLQGSLIRLLRTLRNMRPATTRDFFNLAAVHIRRELLDLARHYRGRVWIPLDAAAADTRRSRPEPTSPGLDDFDLWSRFHEAVDQLPADEREVVGLVFYHGWTQVRIAELFDVDDRTIRRRWSSACQRLREVMGEPIPG